MGIRSWLYWIDRAMAGDRRPWLWLAAWVLGVTILAIGISFGLAGCLNISTS